MLFVRHSASVFYLPGSISLERQWYLLVHFNGNFSKQVEELHVSMVVTLKDTPTDGVKALFPNAMSASFEQQHSPATHLLGAS